MRDIDFLSLVLQTPGALPPIVWGSPGIGKTSRIYQIAEWLKLPLEVVIASIREPSDFAGLPIPENGEGVKMEPPNWAKRLAAAGKGFMFFSEASCAPPAVQAAMMRPILEKVVGDLKLPAGVLPVADANPPDEAAGGWELALPLANRFVHLKWESPTVEEWTDWLMGSASAQKPATVLDLDVWQDKFPQAKAIVASFLRKRPGHLSEEISKIRGRFPLAYSTPRTWFCATQLLATCRSVPNGDLAMQPLLDGTLGEPVSLEFREWLRANDLPDPEDLLANPEDYEPDARKTDQVFAVCLAVGEAACAQTKGGAKLSKKERGERWLASWLIFEKVIPIGEDLVVIPARKLALSDAKPTAGLIDDRVKRIIASLRETIVAAGVTSSN